MAALATEWRTARLSPRERAILEHSEKLTLRPWEMQRGDVEDLRAVGLSEPEILDLNQVVGYYAYANRLTDGLGVPLETFWDEDE